MLLKRKRSESEFSFSPVFSSSHSVNDGFNFNAMSAMDTARRGFFSPRLSVPSHLPSRTLKRFRDNRPPEEEIHQRTLHLLYSAQHRPQELNSQLSQSADVTNTMPSPKPNRGSAQQRSLHSFWNLPTRCAPLTKSPASSPSSSTASLSTTTLLQSAPTQCEDCGASLCGIDDMSIEGFSCAAEGQICVTCGKAVCFSCSISNLGEHRRCLACAR